MRGFKRPDASRWAEYLRFLFFQRPNVVTEDCSSELSSGFDGVYFRFFFRHETWCVSPWDLNMWLIAVVFYLLL